MSNISLFCSIFAVFVLKTVYGAALDHYFDYDAPCEFHCEEAFCASADLKKACDEGCRLFKIIGLAKGHPHNKTMELCLSACSEAFTNDTSVNACHNGCQHHVSIKSKDDPQTLHLLTPFLFVRSAYNNMAHHVRQFITTSWTVYVQEDSGKMIVLQTNHPKIQIENTEYPLVKEKNNFVKNYQPPWQEDRLDWVDCISHQSGIPRWLLVIVLFTFILALLWLCCATAVTAPNHHVSSKKKSVGYVLLCEPNQGLKPPPHLVNCDEEAPPLPPKVSLI